MALRGPCILRRAAPYLSGLAHRVPALKDDRVTLPPGPAFTLLAEWRSVMSRTAFLVISAMLAMSGAAPGVAMADVPGNVSPADEIIQALRSHGYRIVEDERTWLGRQRVVALKDGARRELVFIPGTGEILRDYSVLLSSGDRPGGDLAGVVSMSSDVGASQTRGSTDTVAGVASAPGMSVGDPVGIGAANSGLGAAQE